MWEFLVKKNRLIPFLLVVIFLVVFSAVFYYDHPPLINKLFLSSADMNHSTDDIIAIRDQRIDIRNESYAKNNLKGLSTMTDQEPSLLNHILAAEEKALQAHVYLQWMVKSHVAANEEITALVSQKNTYPVEYIPRDAYILYASYHHAQSVANDSRIKFVSLLPSLLKIDARLLNANATSLFSRLIVQITHPIPSTVFSLKTIAEHWQTHLQQSISPDITIQVSSSYFLTIKISSNASTWLSYVVTWLSEQPETKLINPVPEFHLVSPVKQNFY
jgi:hypothetical protein